MLVGTAGDLRLFDGRDEACEGHVGPVVIGHGERRYELVKLISHGGMGTVHLGRLQGPLGFSRLVAITDGASLIAGWAPPGP